VRRWCDGGPGLGFPNQETAWHYHAQRASSIALLFLTLLHHSSGLTGVFRLFAVLILLLIALGLWKLHNGARVLLFFLCISDIISCLMALFLYALRTSHYRLAVFLVVQMCIAAALAWYLRSTDVTHAFDNLNPWPTTVKMLVLTVFTVRFVWDGEQPVYL
jgi:hypothetical protein